MTQDYALRLPEEPLARDKNIRDPERTAAAILAAAMREFAENGYGGARINEIAARADVNKRMLYHYYGGKDALYLAVLEATYVGIRSAEVDLHLTDRDPVEAIRELARFTWQYFLDHPEFLSIVSTENLLKAKFLKECKGITEKHSPLISIIAEILERGHRQSQFRAGADPVHVYLSIAALGYYYLSNHHTTSIIFSREFVKSEELKRWGEHIADMIVSYLRV
ncbi:TetR family transcriptional regulator [Elstera litoralis]|uniref:TetR family transcriptional regulator n=2 Tax=Elstera litoralis TaxID=552518 RepID=A0A0F3III8_9PROT|nr:TetR family transcriptional regulator [Elstera litoralis]